MTQRRAVYGTLAIAALLLLLGRWLSALYADYLWFSSLGAVEVWQAHVTTASVLGVSSFTVAALFALLNLYAVRQSVVSLILPRRIANIEIGEEVPGRYLFSLAAVLAALVGAALMLPNDTWPQALLARDGIPFGETDPYWGADLGFFVYWLPFETTLHVWSILVLAVVTGLVVGLYALTPSLRWERGSLYVSAYVRRHFTILGGVLMLVLAWSYRLSMYRLLAGEAFTAIDHRVVIPATLLIAVVTGCAALVVTWAGWSGQPRLAFLAVSVVLVLSVVARSIAPLLARRSVDPQEATAQERPYIGTRLNYTRRAYGVDRMRPDSLGAGFASATEASTRVAVWDGATLAQAAQRLRRVRVVGDAAGWQTTPSGELTAQIVEHSSEGSGGADSRDVWGITRFDPTTADDHGMPVRAGVGARLAEETLLDEPAVYPAASDSVVSDSLHQIAGVEMASTLSRFVHSWALQNFRLLFGELPANRPTMVRRRDVRARLAAIAPFFVQGGEVVPVFAADSLYWVVELYTASSTYPLSQRFAILGEERGYFQHAATALVHAASGRVRLVQTATPEPVAASWFARFPQLFVRANALPAALQAVLPPVTDGARVQALAFSLAGFRADSLEVRHFASPDGADSAAVHEPTHVTLPGTGIASLWALLDDQERVRGVVSANGGAHRATSWIPVVSDGQRWGGVLDRLRAIDTSSREGGLVRSPLRAVPVAQHALYVQAVFQWRPGGSPRLLHVESLFGDSLHIGPTLAAALGAPSPVRASEPAPRDLRARADSLYQLMRDAMRRGDWTAFGRAFDALGASLRPSP